MWRLDTADGSWAVKVPFHRSSEDEVRVALAASGPPDWITSPSGGRI